MHNNFDYIKDYLNTDDGLKDGTNFCPNCGSTSITLDVSQGKLKCNYCDTIFEGKKIDEEKIENLKHTLIGTGAKKIDPNQEDIITVKCDGCGAEVVIDTKKSAAARCHWCRNILTINKRIENGTIPDLILPFKINKQAAIKRIEKYVKSKKMFATDKFNNEFNTDKIMGVYLPYVLLDINAHATFSGKGEKLEKRSNNLKKGIYFAKLYQVGREFDITIDDLSFETNSNLLNNNEIKTNNIINSIMPFDTENCVQYNGNYLVGYTSEKRDINIKEINKNLDEQIKDITRISINSDLKFYDRGIKWEQEFINIKGKKYLTTYLPVWLYTFKEDGKEYYIALNGRTNEISGSIPVNYKKLLFNSIIIEFLAIIIYAIIIFIANFHIAAIISFIGLILTGPFFYENNIIAYQNKRARHKYEKETKNKITNLKREDTFIKNVRNLNSPKMLGANNFKLNAINDEKTKKEIITEKLNEMADRTEEKINKQAIEAISSLIGFIFIIALSIIGWYILYLIYK